MNSNSNTDLQSNGTRKPRNRKPNAALIAASIGTALCLFLGIGIASTNSAPAAEPASASVVDTGFCVKATGFDGEFTGDRSYNCGGETFKMLPPTLASSPACVLTPGLMGSDPRVVLAWRVPEEMKDYTVGQAQFGMVRDGSMEPIAQDLLSHIGTTGDPTSYSTTFSAKALSGGLLGSSWTFGIRFVDPESGKTSPWLSAEARMGNAGVNAACTVGVVN